jgi:redox-sensitive bicupin YhaK (pirin superfamily)
MMMCGAELHSLMAVKAVVPMPYHGFDAHSGAHMFRADASLIDPFIGIDSYTMPQPFFGPHPHAGMSAVSLMLPEADGGFINRDSLGDHSLIRPGDLHWTQAGRGMMHEEVPAEPGQAARGLQIFVNLSQAHKQADPVAFKVKHEDMPVVPFEGGGQLRVVAGTYDDGQRVYASPISHDARWLTRVNMLDVSLQPGAHIPIQVRAGDNAFFVIRSGCFNSPNTPIPGKDIAQSAIIFESTPTTRYACIQAGSEALRGVFFSGTPIGQPVYPGGPFMGNSAEDIMQYKRRFAAGEMGQLSKSF